MSDPALDRLEVFPVVKGSGLEPEEAPARHVQSLPLSVNLSNGEPEVESRSGRPALRFPNAAPAISTSVPVTSEMPAGEVAQLWRERCFRCVHFRQEEWRATKRIWEGAPMTSEKRRELMGMVNRYASDCHDHPPSTADLLEASHALDNFGICAALTEEAKMISVVHPAACCPNGKPYYRDRGPGEKRAASAAYDSVLRAAQGKG